VTALIDKENLLRVLSQVISENDPTADVGPGGLSTLLLSPATELAAYSEQKIQDAIDRYDLSKLSVNTDISVLDEMAERYGVIRASAGFAGGVLTLVLDEAFPLVIPAGTEFTSTYGSYVATDAFAIRLAASSIISANDRLLVSRGDGTYTTNITVVATQSGESLNISQGTALTTESDLEHVVAIYANRDFTGGADEEVGADLLTRIRDSRTRPGMETSWGVESLIRDPSYFPLVDSVSVVSSGDQELRRDKYNALAIGGGMTDIYVRTRRVPSTVAINKSAADLGASLGRRQWRIDINRNDFPGWWDVVSVLDSRGNRADIVSDTRGVDLTASPGQLTPVIPLPVFGTYSAFQTSELIVETVAEYTEPAFTVALRGMPQIDEVQELLTSRDFRPVGGDVLVKSPVPMFVSVSLTVEPLNSSVLVPSDADIIQRVVDRVNRSGFSGRLYANQLADSARGDNYTITDILLSGVILLPDGSSRRAVSESYLEIPVLREQQTSWRTAIFVTAPTMITVVRQEASSEQIR
jgi:hypothetical protein